MSALPNATYFGFTGTPIDRTAYGKGTFKIFGVDDPKGYLDKYSIAESIEDGSTVEIHYGLAPNELRVDRETLDREFLSLSEAEGVADFDVLNRVLEKAVNLKNMLKSKERVSKVAQAVAEHFTNYVEPMGFKAFLVAVDREACAFYKDELDKILPPEYSDVIVSPAQNDPPHLQRFHYSEDKEKQIRKAFQKKDELPKILIVTSKLLTGFDAPILYCMYLDKPMRDHTLLQAIARVNRPYEDEEGLVKPCGFILDFVGVFEDLKKALAFDSEDVEDIEKVVKEIGQLKGRFSELMEEGRGEYLRLLEGKQRDKAVESVLEYFQDEKKRKDFQVFYKELSSIYEVISPDPFLSPYLQDYETISRMSALLREAFGPLPLVSREFTKKTAKLVQEHTNSTTPDLSLKVYEIDEHLMDRIKQSKESDTEKVFNIAKSIAKVVSEEAKKNPYLVSISERAESIVQAFVEKQQTAQESLRKLEDIISEMNKAKMEQEEKDIDGAVFTVYWLLKRQGISDAEEAAKAIQSIFEKYPHWKDSKQGESSVRREMYVALEKYAEPKNLFPIVDELIRLLKVGA
jgi:type I restriction enzyme R subunit